MPTAAISSHGIDTTTGSQIIQSQDLSASLPAPILRLLVLFARPISLLRKAIEVTLWKNGRRVESWMLVAGWWGICLGSTHAFKYLLPPLLFLPLLDLSKLTLRHGEGPPSSESSATNPSTSDTLLVTLSDLHSIHALLPPSPIPTILSMYSRFRQLGPVRLIRGLLLIWITWVVLGKIIGFRSLLASAGSIILLLPSPPLAHLVNLLSKSLAVRRTVALSFLFIFGSPPDQSYPISLNNFSPLGWAKSKWTASRRPSLAFSFQPKGSGKGFQGSALEDQEPEGKAGNPIYFRFEVHENQRWWMGLDWTSALLPAERPSWCDSHLLPVSPPPSFTLPAAASIILPAPTKLDPRCQVQRIATWRWLDDDWSVVRAGAPLPPLPVSPTVPNDHEAESSNLGHRPSRSLSITTGLGISPPTNHPSTLEDNMPPGVRAQSIAEHAFTKGLERLKVRTTSSATLPPKATGSSPARTSSEFKRGRTGSQASEDLRELEGIPMAPIETISEKDEATDADGWVYGDNKWESMGARGGLGKFTKRRRWQRRAVCSETVQRLPSEPDLSSSISLKAPATLATVSEVRVEPYSRLDDLDQREKEGEMIPPASPVARDDQLRSRLKKAMGSVGG